MSSQKTTTKRWSKGTSGNPAGRPVGSRNKSTLFIEELLNGESEALIRKAIELALKGETTALRLCLDRLCPPRKERLIEFPLPKIADAQKVATATASILTAVSEGCITPGEAEILARTVQIHAQVLEVEDVARRVAELEKAIIRASENGNHEIATQSLDKLHNFPEESETQTQPEADCGTEEIMGTQLSQPTFAPTTETQPEVDCEAETTLTKPGKESSGAADETRPPSDSSWMDWKAS